MSIIRMVTILFIFSLIIGTAAAKEVRNQSELKVVGEEYVPFSYIIDGNITGLSVDLIKEISADAGMPVNQADITLLPWEKAYNLTKTGNNTLLLAVYRTPDRESDLQWVGPYATDSSAFFIRPNANMTLNFTEDVKNLKVGVISGDAHYDMLKGYGISTKDIVTSGNISALVSMVQNGTIDAFFHGEQEGKWAIKKVTGDSETLPLALRVEEQKVWFGLSPDTPAEVVKALQASLEKKQTSQAVNITS